MFKFSSYILLLMFSTNNYNQNLVLNSSFESHSKNVKYCTTNFKLKGVDEWTQVTYGTVDYIENDKKCIRNKNLIQAQDGKHFIGIYGVLSEMKRNYREYIQGEFSASLVKGNKYHISFYTRLDENSTIQMSGIGAYIHNDSFSTNNNKRLKMNPQICFTEIINSKKWVKIEGYYIANGNEKHITIGVFERFRKVKKKKTVIFGGHCYMYIDNVNVSLVPKT